MLKGPSYYSPIKGYKRLRTRVSAVYKRLVDLKYFHAKPADIWDEARWQQWSEGLKNVVNSSLFSKVLLSKKVLGNGLNEYESHVLASRVVELIGSVKKNKKLSKKYDLGIKAVIGRPFSNNATEPSMLFSNRYANTKEALENHKHQIGSTIKPFIYGTLFSLGVKPTDMVETGPITLKLLSGKWSPREAHKNLPEEVTVEYALQHSYNRPVVRLAQKVGMENLEDGLKHYFPDLNSPLAQYQAQLLGAVELYMKGIYQALTHLIKSQCERSKEWEHQNVLNVLADPTLTTISHRVNKGLKELSFFGKTGTTNKGLDNWFVFFDGDIVGAIWVGHLGARDLKGVKLYGSNTSFEIFQQFLMSRGKRYAEFTCPGQAQEQATL
jgi:penicillin-binding protein 1B